MTAATHTDIFLSCDWGTSKFRLRLISVKNMETLAQEISDWGIQKTNLLWKENHRSTVSREQFFGDVVLDHLQRLAQKTEIALTAIPLLLSGMASADIGIKPLPYKKLPLLTDGSDLLTQFFTCGATKIFLISGVSSPDDVMRGEETQLIGAFSQIKEKKLPHCFIIPGTHTKHIFVKQEKVISFKTYLTGELFALLSEKSILQNSLAKPTHTEAEIDITLFKKGLYDSMEKNLLHSLFGVRTRALFHMHSPIENYYYLNGLLIGAELQDLLLNTSDCHFHLIASSLLARYYTLALQTFNIPFSMHDSEAALIHGQHEIYCKQQEIIH